MQWNHIVQFYFFYVHQLYNYRIFYDPKQVSIDVNVHITTDPNLRANRHAQPLHSQSSCQPLKPNLYQRFTKTDPPMLCHGNSCNTPDWLATCLLSTVIVKCLKENSRLFAPPNSSIPHKANTRRCDDRCLRRKLHMNYSKALR